MSAKIKAVKESKGPSVPAYIVTFSDMVTLLLTFFVMLLSMSSEQDPRAFNKSRNAFVEHVNTFGLGMLMGKKMHPNLSEEKSKYFIANPDKNFAGRSIDAKGEDIRRLYKKVAKSMKSMPSQIVAQRTNFSVTNIGFSPGLAELNGSAKKYLSQFALNLQHDNSSGMLKLYILGLARNERTEKEQWILSAMRANAVADYLKDILPSQLHCPVFSWGAGPGGYWVTQNSHFSKDSQILIAVLRTKD